MRSRRFGPDSLRSADALRLGAAAWPMFSRKDLTWASMKSPSRPERTVFFSSPLSPRRDLQWRMPRDVSDAPVRLAGRLLSPEITQVLGDLRGRIDGDVLSLAFDLEGNALSIEDGGVLRQWDPKTGNLLQSTTLSEIETCWAFSHDGRFLASGSTGLAIWETSEGNLLCRHEDPSWMTALAFSPDSKLVASGHDDYKVRIWNSRTGKLLHVLSGHSDEISAIAFSADGKRLATAAEDRLVYIWDVKLGHFINKLEGHTDRVDDLAWSPSGHRLASAGWDLRFASGIPSGRNFSRCSMGKGSAFTLFRLRPRASGSFHRFEWVCAGSNCANLKIKGEIRLTHRGTAFGHSSRS